MMHYVNWRSIPQPGKKDRKVPWDGVANRAIDHLDPVNWLDEEIARYRVGGDIHLALVLPRLTGDKQYVVFLLDLDDVVGPVGQPLTWAADLLARFPGAHIETPHSGKGYHVMGVRRQGFWDQERPNLRESLAHLVGLIMRRAFGDASGAF